MQTIFSLITGSFGGSVAVIRISGQKTIKCLQDLGFKGILQHQKASLQKICDIKSNNLIDEALVTFFKSPNSFTGEDVAEISIHASPFIIKKMFEILNKIEDVRFAEAGEFSRRAFLNGKMDLVQAEAIPDLIASETEKQHKQALNQLQGELGKIYEDWRFRLIKIAANLEAFIDFPEDDLPQDIIDKIEFEVKELSNEIKSHLSDNKIGHKIKDGLSLAIIGAPNVGKSSLINFFAKSEVAIVSEIAGTTRDVVETFLSIGGIAVKIADTAGLRKTEDLIEKEGIKRALEKAKNADLKIFMLDANNLNIDESNRKLIDEKTIILVNKIDLCEEIPNNIKELNPLLISLKSKINLSEVLNKLDEKIKQILPKQELAVITQERYRIALETAFQYLEEFSLTKNIELAAEDLRMVTREIGKITGKVDIENILDVIFSSFCIGK